MGGGPKWQRTLGEGFVGILAWRHALWRTADHDEKELEACVTMMRNEVALIMLSITTSLSKIAPSNSTNRAF